MINICPLTGQQIQIRQPIPSANVFFYETPKTGKVFITDIALLQAPSLSAEQKQILTGICRNRTISGQEPIEIWASFLNELFNQDIPYGFEERGRHFLQYLYDNGGKEYKNFSINSDRDSPITYSSIEEFENIIRYLKDEAWIETKTTPTKQNTFYFDLHMTKQGKNEIEKGLPKLPMYGLVNQKISTGDLAIDQSIEHARQLFFGNHSTLDEKRSACETLSFVLEPLRDNLKQYFSDDTEVFFNLVNNFNIRHNKNSTKKLQHEEQLEWVFYGLLNTINTFVKLKKKLGAY